MTHRPPTLEAVFVEALEQPQGQREAFVARRCAGDRELEDRALRLLAAHQQTMHRGLLDTPTKPERRPILRAMTSGASVFENRV